MIEKKKDTSNLDLLNDRERILMGIIDGLCSTQIQTAHKAGIQKSDDYADHDGYLKVHFNIWGDPKPGDLVMGRCGRIHAWKIGWYVEKLSGPFGGAMIREIGTNRVCEYVNETFYPIVGLRKVDVLEGEQQVMLVKVMKAFRDGDSDLYRFGGIEFNEPKVAKVWIREKFGGIDKPSYPFYVKIPFTPRTSIAAIMKAMEKGGYGTSQFDKKTDEDPVWKTT